MKPGTCCKCGYSGTVEPGCSKGLSHCNHWWDGPTELPTEFEKDTEGLRKYADTLSFYHEGEMPK